MSEELRAAEPPKWYTEDEIYHWLKMHRYSDQIAKELALLIATNHQLAFNKGWQMGLAERERREKEDQEPVTAEWLRSIGFIEPLRNWFRTTGEYQVSYDLGTEFLAFHPKQTWNVGKKPTRGQLLRLLEALGIERKGGQ